MRGPLVTVVVGLVAASLAPACSSVSSDPGSWNDSGNGDGGGNGGSDGAAPHEGGGGMDAAAPMESGTTTDGGGTEDVAQGDDAPAGCGEYTGDTSFTCSKDGNSRGKCVNGTPTIEMCSRGCLREMSPQDSICMGTTDNWSCNGSYGTERALNGDYDLTSFGCWVDANNNVHTDQGDNCIPSCLNQAIAAGLCMQSDDGPTCEERITWFTADGARFGCLQRLRVTNTLTGKSVIAVALDFGPSCSVEGMVSKAVLDASGRVDLELFGGDQGVSDMANVHVVEVDNSTPLGPI